jgi:hypothetical protein
VAWARWGHGGRRHGAVPAAVRGPVVGPVCRACAGESERARRKNISAGTVHDGLFQGQWCEYLWFPGDDEVIAKEVGAVMII